MVGIIGADSGKNHDSGWNLDLLSSA